MTFLRYLKGDRGDMPGWILITVMTAALVLVIWSAMEGVISSVMDKVSDAVGGG